MKTLQIHLALLVISLYLFIACKVLPKEETLAKETYGIINTILDDYKNPNKPYVTIEETVGLAIDDFNSHMNGQKILKDEGYNPEQCAMRYIESKVKLNKTTFRLKTWDKSKITYNEVSYISRKVLGKNLSMKEANELMGKQIFSFSNPIFDKNMVNAVILLDISREGKKLHFRHKENGKWISNCGYYISVY
ncbi:hypothetical protein [Flagellimonas profundi]|uniref:Lipoprotein n=1 Tax=Flagellimonas profundi TaxID=2915620 RepID=A0ABS3FG47_9FLAO|nr:hypothetical protein [Allomuricauda profundi]MBO0342129.1 hypothetical protein [Allomuricauda profundi]